MPQPPDATEASALDEVEANEEDGQTEQEAEEVVQVAPNEEPEVTTEEMQADIDALATNAATNTTTTTIPTDSHPSMTISTTNCTTTTSTSSPPTTHNATTSVDGDVSPAVVALVRATTTTAATVTTASSVAHKTYNRYQYNNNNFQGDPRSHSNSTTIASPSNTSVSAGGYQVHPVGQHTQFVAQIPTGMQDQMQGEWTELMN